MASRTFPGLALVGEWALGEDGWKPGMDANLRRLSVLVQTSVLSSVAAYPSSPSNGDIHRLTGTADVNKIIVRDQGAWVLYDPFEGMQIWDIAAQTRLTYSVSSGWTATSMSAGAIKTAYESNADTNAFTDAEKTKLASIEAGATDDMNPSEIKAAYESNSDTNAFTDAEKTKLAGLSDPLFKGIHLSDGALASAHPSAEAGSYAYVDAGTESDSTLYIWDDDDEVWVLSGATGGSSETPTTIKTKYESNADTNAFTDAEKTKLAGVAEGATANSSDATLLDRANHTGQQPASTISDFNEAIQDMLASFLVQGSGITLTYDDVLNTLTITSTASGVADNAVTNAKLADMAEGTFKARATAGSGDPEDLTGAQATALLDTFGASGAGNKKGLVPTPGPDEGSTRFLREDGIWAEPPTGSGGTNPIESITISLSDLTSALTTGVGKETIRMPYAFTLTGVRAYLATAQASGSILTVDVNEGGVSILSTKLTINNGEKTSVTATTAAVISDTAIADDAEITFDIDQVGTGGAGLKVVLIGYRT